MSVSRFISKTVPFKFRGMDFTFDLSQGLFSSAGVDAGTKLLLKVFSQILDEDTRAGRPPPRRVVDAGCGAGIIGICAARGIAALGGSVLVRCQDRDELARLFTLHNAAKNGVPPAEIAAFTEPLLSRPFHPGDAAGPEGAHWDLILTNIPAKAGKPVLEDFVSRSAAMLSPGGRVIMVAVHTLADFFREQIAAAAESAGAEPAREETGSGYTVFVYGRREINIPCISDNWHSVYARAVVTGTIEDIPIRLETIHGACGFDKPGGAVTAAAKLLRNIGRQAATPLLIHEPEQGFFPCWLLKFLPQPQPLVLSGRNILALEASRHNIILNGKTAAIVPAADLLLSKEALLEAGNGQYGCIAAFPELLPQSSLPKGADQLATLWESIPPLLAAGGIFLAAFTSSDAERFDRKKPAGFTRLGSVKRHGFRALAYRCTLPEASPPASFFTSSTDT